MIVFLDIETTGLDPKRDEIVEVAFCTAKTESCSHVLRYVPAKQFAIGGTLNLHKQLILDSRAGDCMNFEDSLITTLEYTCGPEQHTLCGFSVHFDYYFLKEKAPAFASFFSHQLIDLTSLALFHGIEKPKNVAHRAVPDAQMARQFYMDIKDELKTVRD